MHRVLLLERTQKLQTIKYQTREKGTVLGPRAYFKVEQKIPFSFLFTLVNNQSSQDLKKTDLKNVFSYNANS